MSHLHHLQTIKFEFLGKMKKNNIIWILTRLESFCKTGGQSERWSTRLLTIHEVWDYQWKEDLWYLKLRGQSWWCLPDTGQKTIKKGKMNSVYSISLFFYAEWRLWKFPAEIHEKTFYFIFLFNCYNFIDRIKLFVSIFFFYFFQRDELMRPCV